MKQTTQLYRDCFISHYIHEDPVFNQSVFHEMSLVGLITAPFGTKNLFWFGVYIKHSGSFWESFLRISSEQRKKTGCLGYIENYTTQVGIIMNHYKDPY